MPVSLVAETQVVVWYLREPGRLTEKAASALQAVTATGNLIGVSAFSIVELVNAAEKRTNPFTFDDLDVVVAALALPTGPFAIVEIDAEIAAQVRLIPRVENADPGDRIIVATAEVLRVPLVSADGKVSAMTSGPVVW